MATLDRHLTALALTLALTAGALPQAHAACEEASADPAARLSGDVDAAAGAQKLQQIKDAVLALAQASGWIHPGYVMHITVPGVNEFEAHAKNGDGVLELFGSSHPTTFGAKLKSLGKPDRFSQFRLFVRIKADGSLLPDAYGRAQVDRFESTGRYYRIAHKLANAKDVAKDVAKDPQTFKGLLLSGAAVVTHVASAGTFTTALSAVLGWKGIETITKAIQDVQKARAGVLQATLKSVGSEADGKNPPTYQEAYRDYLSAMHKAGLSGVMGATDFIRELNEAGIVLE